MLQLWVTLRKIQRYKGLAPGPLSVRHGRKDGSYILNEVLAASSISDLVSETLFWAIDHLWPNGSLSWPYRSPQNWSASGIVTIAPAATAFAHAASTSST